MFTEIIAVYSDNIAEYINKFCEQISDLIKVVADDTYRSLCCLTLRRLMSYIYGAPILDVSRSHTTTQHSR